MNSPNLREINEHLVLSSLRERELSEAAEREKAQLNALLEALSDGVLMADGAGRVLMFNDAARRMLGIESSLERSALLFALESLDVRRLDLTRLPREEQPLIRALRGGPPIDAELLFVRADGETRRLVTSGTRTMDGVHVALTLVVLRDVTERAQLEQRLAQTERLAAIGTLAAGLAHEINNPLAYVTGNVDFALHAVPEAQEMLLSLDTEEARVIAGALGEIAIALRDAQEGCTRVHRIVSDVNGFGRADSAERTTLDLSDVLDRAIRMSESLLRECAAVRRDYAPAPFVSANAAQLGQVFMNLLVNAAQAIGEGDTAGNEISITLRTGAKGVAVVDIHDSAPGIPHAIQPRIFDPFFTTKPVGKGSGLGLSISHSIVTSLGGDIAVMSEPGEGATFRVTLPPAPKSASAPPRVVARDASTRARILVIDDEPNVARVMKRILARFHDVVAMTNAQGALDMLASDNQFDVILCDLMMPVMSGIAFFEKLQIQNPALATKVVFCSGGAYTPEAQDFLRTTTNPTLSKPVQAAALFRLVDDLVRPKRER